MGGTVDRVGRSHAEVDVVDGRDGSQVDHGAMLRLVGGRADGRVTGRMPGDQRPVAGDEAAKETDGPRGGQRGGWAGGLLGGGSVACVGTTSRVPGGKIWAGGRDSGWYNLERFSVGVAGWS